MSVNNNKQAQQATKGKAEVGAKAPGFTLPTQAGTQVSLSDFIGKTAVVLYFYPKNDWTPVNIGV